MAIAVDASTPDRFADTDGSATSAAFTAPTDALLVACVSYDAITSDSDFEVVSDLGGLTWTNHVLRAGNETTTGGSSQISTARTTSSVSRTVTVATTNTNQVSVKVYVLTGVDVDGTPVDTVGAGNEGGSATNNLTTTSITPGANGLLICCDTDYSALGVLTSADLTIDSAHYPGLISAASGYKACTSGVGVTGNLDAAGTGTPQHKWTQIVAREEAGGAPAAAVRRSQILTMGVS